VSKFGKFVGKSIQNILGGFLSSSKRLTLLSISLVLAIAVFFYSQWKSTFLPKDLKDELVAAVKSSTESLNEREKNQILDMLADASSIRFSNGYSQVIDLKNGSLNLSLSTGLLKMKSELASGNKTTQEVLIDEMHRDGLSYKILVTLLHESVHWRDIILKKPYTLHERGFKKLPITDKRFVLYQTNIIESEYHAFKEEYSYWERLSKQKKVEPFSCSLWLKAYPVKIWSKYTEVSKLEYALGSALLQYNNNVLPSLNRERRSIKNSDLVQLTTSIRKQLDQSFERQKIKKKKWAFPLSHTAKCKSLKEV
jgi:hypothetical protein